MGLTEDQIMSKPSDELILKPKKEQETTPPKKKGVDYRSRPLYVAWKSNARGSRVVWGLVSKDDHNFFIGLEGKWYFGDDQGAQDEIAETSLYRVSDDDKIYVVNSFMPRKGRGTDGLKRITLEELLP